MQNNNVRRLHSAHTRDTLVTGGGGPHDGGMEARVAALEISLQYVQRDVAEVRTGMTALQASASTLGSDVAVIKERLTHIPTKLGMWAAVGLVVASVGGGLWWIVQQYLGPILVKAAGG